MSTFVIVEYPARWYFACPRGQVDRFVRREMWMFGGVEVGAGMGMGYRDMSFDMPGSSEAKAAALNITQYPQLRAHLYPRNGET